MGDADTIRGVWRASLVIIASYPLATLVPAAVLGAIGEVPGYLMEGRPVSDQFTTLATAFLAYYLYLAYAEGIVGKIHRGEQRRGLGGAVDDLIAAAPFVPGAFVAALVVNSCTVVATLLLVIPGLWLTTRWSLTTPVIRAEGLGPIAAITRSNRLVKGRFWFVFATASAAYYLEGTITHFGALVGGLVTGSHTWGEWVAGSLVATLIMPLAAFGTSLAYSSVARRG